MANPNWVKGVSGNPRGRPTKDRAIATHLTRELRKPANRKAIAELITNALRTGRIQFEGEDKPSILSIRDWLYLWDKVMEYTEGKLPTDVNVGADGEVIFRIIHDGISDTHAGTAPETAGVPEQSGETQGDLRGAEGRQDDGCSDAGSDAVSGG